MGEAREDDMNTVTKLKPAKAPVHDIADVLEIDGALVVVESRAWGVRTLERAPSCLLEPRVGDRVLVIQGDGEGYVLGVLRTEGTTSRLRVDGDLELEAHGGSLRLNASQDVSVVGGRVVSMVGSALRLTAAQGEMFFEKLAYVGRELAGDVGAAKLVAGTLHSFVDRLQQHLKRSFRTVEESEQVLAGRLDYRAEAELELHAKHAFVRADELVKVTGEQIHMG
jgi:hypothetical protein